MPQGSFYCLDDAIGSCTWQVGRTRLPEARQLHGDTLRKKRKRQGEENILSVELCASPRGSVKYSKPRQLPAGRLPTCICSAYMSPASRNFGEMPKATGTVAHD